MMKIEKRSAEQVIIAGYVNAVGRESKVLQSPINGNFVEIIKSGTFQNAIDSSGDIALMYNHDRKIGSIKQGNLELYEDNVGLYAKAIITDEQVIQSAIDNKIRGWSFGFKPIEEEWTEPDPNGIKKRIITKMELFEVSILDIEPAYIATSITDIEMRADATATTKIKETRLYLEDKVEIIDSSDSDEIFGFEKDLELIKIKNKF